MERLTCAAPGYLNRLGSPRDPDSLDGHRMVGLRSLTTGNLRPLEFALSGTSRTVMTTISVTGTEGYLPSAQLGLGLVQVLRFHAQADLEGGTLVHVLPDCPPPSTPVSLLYPRNRQLSPRVRVFLDWRRRSSPPELDESFGS